MTKAATKNNFTFKSIIDILNFTLFPLIFLVFGLTGSDKQGLSFSWFKYAALILGIVVSFFAYLQKYYLISYDLEKQTLKKRFSGFILLLFLIVIYSFIRSLLTGHFTTRTLQELFFLASPMLYSFLLVTTIDFKLMSKLYVFVFFETFILYLFSIKLSFSEIFYSLFETSFFESYSPLESSVFSGIATSFAYYFLYQDKKYFLKIMSILFVFMTFKRLSIIFVIFLFVFSFFKKTKNIYVGKKCVVLVSMFLFLFLLFYLYFVYPDNRVLIEGTFKIDLSSLTMTRSDRFAMLMSRNFSSYGFGSVTDFMYSNFDNVSLEMDLIKIIIELGFLPALVFIYVYLNFGRKCIYVFLIMIYEILNLIFASSLTSTFSWIISFTSVCMISNSVKYYKRY